jgi:mannose-6-phosphate isomerase-like protein (cupin superfamily)
MTKASGLFLVGEGKTYQLGQIRITFKPTTSGDYSLCEMSNTPGSGAALHRHAYDEWHIIIEGTYECRVGEEVRTLGPGDMMFAPGGTPHSIKSLGPGVGRQLGITSPAGVFEAFVAEVVESQVDSGSASRQGAPAFRDIAAKHGIEMINA